MTGVATDSDDGTFRTIAHRQAAIVYDTVAEAYDHDAADVERAADTLNDIAGLIVAVLADRDEHRSQPVQIGCTDRHLVEQLIIGHLISAVRVLEGAAAAVELGEVAS